MAIRIGYPWNTQQVKTKRAATNKLKDTRNFSGKGRYTPQPGRGPYAWKDQSEPSAPFDGGEASLRGTEPEGWHVCPSSSHLASIRLVYSLDDSEPWILQVRFKTTPNGKGGGEYWYFAHGDRKTRLETIYGMMESAESPGEIIWSSLILEEFVYKEVVSRD